MSNNDTIAIRLYTDAVRFTAGLISAEGRLHKFGGNVKQEFESLKGVVGSLEGKLASLGVSAGIVANIMQSARMDKGLIQIGQTAGVSQLEVAGLREELFRMGKETGQSVDDLKDGFNNAVQSGLNFKEALPVIDAVSKSVAVTGANANTLTSGLTVAATAFQFDLSKPGQAVNLLDQMTVAGRLGNAELQNLSDIFARVGPNAQSAGLGFTQTLAFIEGLSMIERQPERLATLADSTLRLFNNLNYTKEAANAIGVKFFNKDESRRDSMAVIADIKKQYDKLKTDKQRALFMQSAFGKADLDTIKGIRILLSGDTLSKIGTFSNQISNASGTIAKDLPAAINNSVDQVGRLKSSLREAADNFAKPINETLSNAIRFGMDKKENGGLALNGKDMELGAAGLAIGTLAAARYGGKAISALAGKAGGIGAGVAAGKVLESTAGVTPVFVVNMPSGGIAGSGIDVPAGISKEIPVGVGKDTLVKGASLASKFKVGAALLGGMDLASIPALGAGATATAGLAVGAAGAAGYGVGLGGSALAGYAAKGTRMEGFQTDVIGASIAKALAFVGIENAKQAVAINEKIGETGSAVTGPGNKQNQNIGGTLNIKIDSEGRPRVVSMKPNNPLFGFNVDSGYTMQGG
ncbi:MAG: phage tail tape measure protein [Gallionella sp.]|jgi:TP901 family phage tail tape measure protein